MLLWHLSNCALDGFLLSETIQLDTQGKDAQGIQAMADAEVLCLNEELEVTREQGTIRFAILCTAYNA